MAYRISDACINCGLCAQQCPMNSEGKCIKPAENKHEINPDICISCGTCAAVCPVGAPEEE